MEKKPFRIAKSCGGKQWDPEACFRGMAEAGIGTMELSFSRRAMCESLDWKQHEKLAKTYGIELWSYHLPFGKDDPSNPDPELREETLQFLFELIRKVSDIGVQTFVIHGCSGMNYVVPRVQRIAYAKESLARLAEVAQNCGAVIAVENQPKIGLGRTYEEMLDVLSADDRLKFCLDVNHLLLETASEYVPMLADRLHTIHISDYDFKNERHWLPGEGLIDWQALIALLKEHNYSGPFLYEVGAPPSIDRRPLTYADFKNNYDTLMAGKIPEPIGKPIPELCTHWMEKK